MSFDDSIVTNHCPLDSPILLDENIIDINQADQQETFSSSMNHEFVVNDYSSMDIAVKMVQPIVDIIFNAFDDQLKTAREKTIQSSTSHHSSTSPLRKITPYQLYPPFMFPYLPFTKSSRPIILHAVDFNIPLTTKTSTIPSREKQNPIEQYTTNKYNDNYDLSTSSLAELKQKIISCILPNNIITDHKTNYSYQRKRHKLKRMVQLVVFGVSVLCGYFLL